MSNHGKITRTSRHMLKCRDAINQAAILRRIDKVEIGIEKLSGDLYGLNNNDPQVRLHNLNTYRVEVIRGFVLYLQLSIENLLKELLVYRLKAETRVLNVKQIKHFVEDMRSRDIVGWSGRLNVVTKSQYNGIVELNRVRNSCAHNWLLELPQYRKDKCGKRVKIHVVRFNGKNLLNEDVFRDEFMPVYSKIYLRLLGKVWRIKKYI